jgi:aspartate/methionine/tyrosine aminotransferase
MPRIASRVSQLNGEGALAVYSRAKELERAGRSIIHLELGEPDFHPAAPVVDAVRDAVAAGRDRYASTRGIPALREGIAEYLKRTRRLQVAPEQVLVAPGCKMALSLAMMALIEPGDEVRTASALCFRSSERTAAIVRVTIATRAVSAERRIASLGVRGGYRAVTGGSLRR